MNKEQTAIAKTRVQWNELAETGGESKPYLNNVYHNCYLCQYASEKGKCTGTGEDGETCKYCPYYKKYGFCGNIKKPFGKWVYCKTTANRRIHAKAFLAQIKALPKPKGVKK